MVSSSSEVHGTGIITTEAAQKALALLEIDEQGLEPTDRKIIDAIINKFQGGPVGLQALAATTSEEEETIIEVYEPYLMQIGFIERTPRGRVATHMAYNHLGLVPPAQGQLV